MVNPNIDHTPESEIIRLIISAKSTTRTAAEIYELEPTDSKYLKGSAHDACSILFSQTTTADPFDPHIVKMVIREVVERTTALDGWHSVETATTVRYAMTTRRDGSPAHSAEVIVNSTRSLLGVVVREQSTTTITASADGEYGRYENERLEVTTDIQPDSNAPLDNAGRQALGLEIAEAALKKLDDAVTPLPHFGC